MAWIGGVLNLVGGRRDNYFNKEEADKARDWSKDMSNTEIQRRVQDMKLAGINPMLAASSGGASTPGASQAAPSTSGRSMGDAFQSAYFSAQQLKMAREKNAADVAQVEATTAKTMAETKLIEAEIPFSASNAFLKNESLAAGMFKLREEMKTAQSEAEVRALMPEMQRMLNKAQALDMTRRQAEEEFFKHIGEGSKWAPLIRDLIIGYRSLNK